MVQLLPSALPYSSATSNHLIDLVASNLESQYRNDYNDDYSDPDYEEGRARRTVSLYITKI
jgi:hypothetical protein